MGIQINMLKKGERFRLHQDTSKIYFRRGYIFIENMYACSPVDDPWQADSF